MCGRFSLFAPPDVLARRFGIVDVPVYAPRYNIAPTQDVVVVQAEEGRPARRVAKSWTWGLPKEGAPGAPLVINARSETVAQRALFKEAFQESRVLVPANGFFEWQEAGGRKLPYWFTVADQEPFAIAGIGLPAPGEAAGPLSRVVLLTTDANDVVSSVHDRMPVILQRDQEATWLDARSDASALQEVLQPYPGESMQARRVSNQVNRSSVEGPQLIEPDAQTRLF